MDTLFSSKTPVLAKRGVHIDLKGLPPTPKRMIELLKLFAAARYNVVLVEWEDSFPWTVDIRFRSPTCYSPEDIAHFVKGVRPILWHDMMIDWDSQALRALAAKCDLMPWGYRGHPDTTNGHYKTDYIKRFSEHGFTLWGGTAYKGAEGFDADVPDLPLHTENAQAWE